MQMYFIKYSQFYTATAVHFKRIGMVVMSEYNFIMRFF